MKVHHNMNGTVTMSFGDYKQLEDMVSRDITSLPEDYAAEIIRLRAENAALTKVKSRLEKTLIHVLINMLTPSLKSEGDDDDTL